MSRYIKYERWTFPEDKIKEGNLYLAASLLASSLEVNSFSATVECDDPGLMDFQRNAQLQYYQKPDMPMVFRVQDIERVAPELYHITATSTLGLLSEGQHYGGIYTGQTAQEIIADICGTVDFIVKRSMRGIKLYGWLPIAAPRDNLAQVLFAMGAALKTDLDGTLRIETLWDGISGSVGEDRMYMESSVKYTAPVTSVVVTEHQFIKSGEEKELYKGEAMEGDIVTFSEPMHSLTASGFAIRAQGANFAKLGAGTGTLTGRTYTHTTREVVKAVSSALNPNVKSAADATLVSMVNAKAVANRLANFYQWRETVDAQSVYRGELPGDRLAVYHPFDRVGVASCLQSADINLSNVLKAQEKSLVGFIPEQLELIETFDHRELLTGSGEWTVPEGVTEVIAVLIGGGSGGQNGSAPTNITNVSVSPTYKTEYFSVDASGVAVNNSVTGGTSVSISTSGCGNTQGGIGGAGGAGGMILRKEIKVTPLSKISYTCGAGGAAGAAGGATIFGSDKSFYGSTNPAGYTDVITGDVFAVPGINGENGGAGGSAGADGSAVGGISGGSGTPSSSSDINITRGMYSYYTGENDEKYRKTFLVSQRSYYSHSFSGGGGGGAGGNSGGNNGSPGAVGTSITISGNTNDVFEWTATLAGRGYGGRGADGNAGLAYGAGGNGGGGGGGTGAVGNLNFTVKGEIQVLRQHTFNPKSQTFTGHAEARIGNSSGASGSPGGTGGAGAPGCIILYYGTKKTHAAGQFVDKNRRIFLDKHQRRFIV